VKSCRPALGTYVEIRVEATAPTAARAAIHQAFTAIERVQSLMSAHADDSELSRLNGLAPGVVVEVDAWTHDVLSCAQAIHAASDGLFDCGIAPHLARWGLLPERAGAAGQGSSLANLELLPERRLRFTAPTCLDLGGIAKGYAVDQAATALQAAGVGHAVINAGGDLRVLGDCEEAIYLRHPDDPRRLQLAGHLKDGACATSGTYYSRRDSADGAVSALVDPRSGAPLLSRHSYSVVAPSAMVADALTKVLALLGHGDHPCFTQFSAHPLIL